MNNQRLIILIVFLLTLLVGTLSALVARSVLVSYWERKTTHSVQGMKNNFSSEEAYYQQLKDTGQ